MALYLIKLSPIGGFFFGGENTFGKNGKDQERRGNYLVHSTKFPQQTTILGMIRKELLIQSGTFKESFKDYTEEDKKKINSLIGSSSFKIEGKDKNSNNFGLIKGISPIFIINEKNEIIVNLPKDQSHANESEYIPFKLYEVKDKVTGEAKGKSSISNKKLYTLKTEYNNNLYEYDAKNGLYNKFVNIETKYIMDEDDIFTAITRVGNQKNNHNDPNKEDGFYKLTSYNLKNNNSFAFVIDCDFNLKNSIITMGGLQSTFRMTCEKLDEQNNKKSIDMWIEENIGKSKFFTEVFKNNDNKIIFISPSYLDRKGRDIPDFSIVTNINFRNMETTLKSNGRVEWTNKKYNFIDRGSVFFIDENKEKKINQLLEENKYMRKIGYNYFVRGEYKNEK